MTKTYEEYLTPSAISAPLRAVERVVKGAFFAFMGIPNLFFEPIDQLKGIVADSLITRSKLANGFADFLQDRFGDLLTVGEKGTISVPNHMRASIKSDPINNPFSYRVNDIIYQVGINNIDFYNFQFSEPVEQFAQGRAVDAQVTKLAGLIGIECKGDEIINLKKGLLLQVDISTSETKAKLLDKMKEIDENLPQIRVEIEKLIALGKGEILSEANAAVREMKAEGRETKWSDKIAEEHRAKAEAKESGEQKDDRVVRSRS